METETYRAPSPSLILC